MNELAASWQGNPWESVHASDPATPQFVSCYAQSLLKHADKVRLRGKGIIEKCSRLVRPIYAYCQHPGLILQYSYSS